jgi:hypothetical protein
MDSIPLGESPLVDAKVERTKNTFLVLKKEGYEDQSLLLKHRFNYWFWGNIICGELLGATTDSMADATVQLTPTQYHVVLNPKKASLEQREQFARMKTMRNLTLVGDSEVQQNLAVGQAEYLASLLVTLRVPVSEQGMQYVSCRRLWRARRT